jgi:predicted RNase H-related nuclease YkuK (DUF458 family)
MPMRLKERLMKEAWTSLTVAFDLSPILPKNAETIIHIDVNRSLKHKSGPYYAELASMISGQGFKVMVKPDAWAAQSVADRFSKNSRG